MKQSSGKITIYSKMSGLRDQLTKIKLFAMIFVLSVFGGAIGISAQEIEVKIKISESAKVRVELKLSGEKTGNRISFLYRYADVFDLDKRIENLRAFDKNDKEIPIKKLGAGEYQTVDVPAKLIYDINVKVPQNPAAKAHISWLAETGGLLMPNDLLPQDKKKIPGKIVFETPADWKIASSEKKIGTNIFATEDLEKAVFFVGKDGREKNVRIDKTNLSLVISGGPKFSDDEAIEQIESVLTEYEKIFDKIPSERVQVFLLPLADGNQDNWRAETRGQTVTIISGALPFKREALQRLHEQLRHEIFHLWIPNAVNLSGNYDWFYEGFAVYQALRTGVMLNQIRFEDYLNTLSYAFNSAKNRQISLVEMSNGRWAGTNNSVYAKGMAVAFLCDLAMLDQSKGKRSVTEIFQKFYRKHHSSSIRTDGNAAVLSILKTYPELQPIAAKYIEGKEKIEFREAVKPFGLEISENNGFTRLKISAELTGRQKDLLDKLGYNQWRKLLR